MQWDGGTIGLGLALRTRAECDEGHTGTAKEVSPKAVLKQRQSLLGVAFHQGFNCIHVPCSMVTFFSLARLLGECLTNDSPPVLLKKIVLF